MGYVNEGGAESLIELGNLGTHLSAELRIQVGKRLVEKEYLRMTYDSTTHRNTLSLTAGESLRLSLEVLLDAEDAGSFFNLLLDFFLRSLSELQTERHVIINGHMGIKRVVLEYHRDISVLRRNVVNESVADVELALGNIFKTCDHTESSGFTAAGGTYENDKFLVLDFQVEILYGSYVAVIDFSYVAVIDFVDVS